MIVEKIFIVETVFLFFYWMFRTERKFRREQRAAYYRGACSKAAAAMIEFGKALGKLG